MFEEYPKLKRSSNVQIKINRDGYTSIRAGVFCSSVFDRLQYKQELSLIPDDVKELHEVERQVKKDAYNNSPLNYIVYDGVYIDGMIDYYDRNFLGPITIENASTCASILRYRYEHYHDFSLGDVAVLFTPSVRDFIKRDKKRKRNEIQVFKDNSKRTVDLIYDVLRNNRFENFVTLTINPSSPDLPKGLDATDAKACNHLFSFFFKKMRDYCRDNGFDYSYLCVFERQENGNIHAHYLDNVPINSDLGRDLYPRVPIRRPSRKKHGWIYIEYPEVKFWNIGHGLEKKTSTGFSSVGFYADTSIVSDENLGTVNRGFAMVEPLSDEKKTAKYLTKTLCEYVTKDLKKLASNWNWGGAKRVIKSQNLAMPEIIYACVEVDSDDRYYHRILEYMDELGDKVALRVSKFVEYNSKYDDMPISCAVCAYLSSDCILEYIKTFVPADWLLYEIPKYKRFGFWDFDPNYKPEAYYDESIISAFGL